MTGRQIRVRRLDITDGQRAVLRVVHERGGIATQEQIETAIGRWPAAVVQSLQRRRLIRSGPNRDTNLWQAPWGRREWSLTPPGACALKPEIQPPWACSKCGAVAGWGADTCSVQMCQDARRAREEKANASEDRT